MRFRIVAQTALADRQRDDGAQDVGGSIPAPTLAASATTTYTARPNGTRAADGARPSGNGAAAAKGGKVIVGHRILVLVMVSYVTWKDYDLAKRRLKGFSLRVQTDLGHRHPGQQRAFPVALRGASKLSWGSSRGS